MAYFLSGAPSRPSGAAAMRTTMPSPGRVIPDGADGAIATWTVGVNDQYEALLHPYKAARVSQGAISTVDIPIECPIDFYAGS
jgi:hypothetical protein